MLAAVAEGGGGVGMDFDQQAVGADGDSGARERDDHVGATSGVTGVDEDRQMRFLLRHGDGTQVERVAAGVFEGADAPFAEDDLGIAMQADVFGGEEPFIDQAGNAAFQQDDLARSGGGGEQRDILCVARADLQHVGAGGHHLDVLRRQDLGHDRQVGGVAGLL